VAVSLTITFANAELASLASAFQPEVRAHTT